MPRHLPDPELRHAWEPPPPRARGPLSQQQFQKGQQGTLGKLATEGAHPGHAPQMQVDI